MSIEETTRIVHETTTAWNNWNTLQAVIGVAAGVTAVRATGPQRGALAYGAGALAGYFLARRFVLPV